MKISITTAQEEEEGLDLEGTTSISIIIITINTSIKDPSSHLVVIQTLVWIYTCDYSFIHSSMYSIMMMLCAFMIE